MGRVAGRTREWERVVVYGRRRRLTAMLGGEHRVRGGSAAVLRLFEQREATEVGVGEVDTPGCPLWIATGVGAQKTNRRAHHRVPEPYEIYVRDASPDVRVRHGQLLHDSFHPILPGGCLQHPTFGDRVTLGKRPIVGPNRRTPLSYAQRLMRRHHVAESRSVANHIVPGRMHAPFFWPSIEREVRDEPRRVGEPRRPYPFDDVRRDEHRSSEDDVIA